MRPSRFSYEPASSIWFGGLDGCRDGWALALWNPQQRQLQLSLVEDLEELLTLPAWPLWLAVDMPLGLSAHPEPGGRLCDRLARAYLPPGRKACVFSAPSQVALAAFRRGGDYRAVLKAQRGSYLGAPGLSLQAFYLLKKIDALDSFYRKFEPQYVFESHPELAFFATGKLLAPKQTAAGALSRRRHLKALTMPIGIALQPTRRPSRPPLRAAENDWLDACVLASVASKRARGRAVYLGEEPSPGGALPQQIWY